MTRALDQLVPVLALALASCQSSPDTGADLAEGAEKSVSVNGDAPAADAVPGSPARPADDALVLQPITLEDTRGKLPEELGCAFAADGDARSPALLIGKGYVSASEPPKAAVNIDGHVRVLTSERGGGYGTLTAGTNFADGEGLRVTLARGSAARAEDGFEAKTWLADLTVRSRDGHLRTYSNGRWTCGP